MTPDVLALDLDGVLINTFDIHKTAWAEVVHMLDGEAEPDDFDDLRSVPTETAMRAVLHRKGLNRFLPEISAIIETKIRFRDELLARYVQIPLEPEASRLLADAKASRCFIVCLATTTAAPVLIHKAGLERFLDKIVYGTDLTPPKRESAGCLLSILTDIGARPGRCLYIDDCVEAVELALGAGIPSLAWKRNGTEQKCSLKVLYNVALIRLQLSQAARR